MFPPSTYLKIIKYLNLTIADEAEVKAALTTAEATLEVEVEVSNVLTKIDTLEQALLAERSSPNSAMTRADVVEWQPGKRTAGMLVALKELKQQLANLLGLEYEIPSNELGTVVTRITAILP
ncbi:MAG: hypothetical protein ACRC2S_28580 [Waterburya sp.]